jgi:membrane-bound lytic murein transglycosylase MltF
MRVRVRPFLFIQGTESMVIASSNRFPRVRRAVRKSPLAALTGAVALGIFILALALLVAPSPARAQSTLPADPTAMALPIYPPFTGDFDEMKKTRLVRILVPYSKTIYFIDKGAERGIAAEAGREFEAWLNKKYKTKSLKIRIAFVPVSRDRLLPALVEGRGDIVAASLTITPERLQTVDFADPWAKNVKEVVVTGPAAPSLASLDDLAGQQIMVRKSSSYYTHLLALNETLKAKGLAEVKLVPAEETLEDEDLLEMVNAGLLPMAVVDDYKAQIWAKILDKLKVRSDLAVNEGGQIAWAIRKNSPLLLAEVDEFVASHGLTSSSFGAEVKRKYYGSTKILKNSYAAQDRAEFRKLSEYFKKYASQYSFDYLMIAAQGYQESQLKQTTRSHMGAVGVMQMLPSTAADPKIGITGVDKSAQKNIEAGVKYLRLLVDTYLNDPAIDQTNKTLMAFAAYNAGPGNLARFRKWAKQSGLDPNVWFFNVEEGAARIVGQETVSYVGNIYKYYIAYRLAVEAIAADDPATSP